MSAKLRTVSGAPRWLGHVFSPAILVLSAASLSAASFSAVAIAAAPGQNAGPKSGAAANDIHGPTLCVSTKAGTTLDIRFGPSKRHALLARIPQGTCGLKVAGQCVEGWCEVEHAGRRGWADTRFITVEERATPGPGRGAPPVGSVDTDPDVGTGPVAAKPMAPDADASDPAGAGASRAAPLPTTDGTPASGTVVATPPASRSAETGAREGRARGERSGRKGKSAAATAPRPSGKARKAGRAIRDARGRARRGNRHMASVVVFRPYRPRAQRWPWGMVGGMGAIVGPGFSLGFTGLRFGSGRCVVGVAGWDTLRLRTGPGTGHPAIAGIPPRACGVVRSGPCVGSWCAVRFRRFAGWVNASYLD